MSLKVDEVMVKDVVKLQGNVTAEEVAVIMEYGGIGCVIIIQNESPIGIITEGDMLRRVLIESRDPRTTMAFQIMTAPLFFGSPRMSIQDAVRLINERKIGKLPIVDDKGHLVGMITLTDLARSVAYLEHIFSRVENNAKH